MFLPNNGKSSCSSEKVLNVSLQALNGFCLTGVITYTNGNTVHLLKCVQYACELVLKECSLNGMVLRCVGYFLISIGI